MIRLLSIFIFLCFIISGCKEYMDIEAEIAIDQWLNSTDARKGYIQIIGRISPDQAANVIKQIIELNNMDEIERIKLIIYTQGGEASSFRAIVNGIKMSKKPVDTINIKWCHSAGAGIYASATGKRYALPNTTFKLHTVHVDTEQNGAKDYKKIERKIYEDVIRKNSNLPEDWFPLTSRLITFSAEEALQYNFVDEIITELP